MKLKANIMDETMITRAIARMSHEIIEHNHGVDNVFLVGIQRRGVPLAKEIAKVIESVTGKNIPVGFLDITLYRDDLSTIAEHPQIKGSNLPFPIEKSNIILVDDVLYTGRTIRAAINIIMEFGRAKTVQLAVLIDRGNRELPIGANYIGKNIPTSKDEIISVSVKDIDGKESVDIYSLKD